MILAYKFVLTHKTAPSVDKDARGEISKLTHFAFSKKLPGFGEATLNLEDRPMVDTPAASSGFDLVGFYMYHKPEENFIRLSGFLEYNDIQTYRQVCSKALHRRIPMAIYFNDKLVSKCYLDETNTGLFSARVDKLMSAYGVKIFDSLSKPGDDEVSVLIKLMIPDAYE